MTDFPIQLPRKPLSFISSSSLLSSQAPAMCPHCPTYLWPIHAGHLALICAVFPTFRVIPTKELPLSGPMGTPNQSPHQPFIPLFPQT